MNEGLFFQGSSESLNLQKKAKKQLAQATPGILDKPAVTSGLMTSQTMIQPNQTSANLSNSQQPIEDKKKIKTTMRNY